ncbi:MAG: LPS-assembly protein LptD [Tannerellaceae bacterium]|nr:LPS-assembly protein LptD [Tannerellaceae bacterium]MCD8263889.1 LPS-assembly protein LptD [Tannerellaceae bacterium]
MFSKYRGLIILLFFLIGGWFAKAQEITVPIDSVIPVITDSMPASVLVDSIPPVPLDSIIPEAIDSGMPADSIAPAKQGPLDAPVFYQAEDSIVMTAGNWAYLFGEADVKYQEIQLQSELIEMNLDSSLVYARFDLDSLGNEFGYPLFIDRSDQYESRTMRYNFKTQKGYITDVITQQGEGYVTAGRTKKMDDDILNMVGGRYTTCDNHDHPHFYIHITKAKVRPNKNIVTGPAYLVFEDVPLYPLGLPFCFFPFSSSYSSGILMPTFGDESQRGFFLRDGGYYFAINDYVDLALTGEIYTKGSWGLTTRSSYRKRYKYSGSFNANYIVTKLGDKTHDFTAPDYSLSKDFKISWTHTQDAKANPYRTLSASVNFSTSSYNRNSNIAQTTAEATQNTKSSTISVSQRFPNSPFSMSATMSVNQRTQDSTLAVTLPDLTFTLSRVYPLKRKNAIGKERWYEKVSMSYTGYLRNSVETKESEFFQASLIKDWRNAMQHTIPVSATFSIFKYFNISPSFNYTERWYTNKIEQEFDPALNSMVARDTTYGFYRVYNYTASVSASTTVYGFFKLLPFLGDKVEMIRHRMEPTLSFNIAPDFGNPRYGYYENYAYDRYDGVRDTITYSLFSHQIFGAPGRGKSGNIAFSLDNNLEMKIRTDKDSTGFRKISLIDKLSLSGSYNLAADSFQWSDLNVGLRIKFSKSYTMNITGVFDTYTYESNAENTSFRRVNKPRWTVGKGIGRLRSTSLSYAYTFNNETFSKWFGGKGSGVDPAALAELESEIPDGTIGGGPEYFENEDMETGVRRLRTEKEDTSGDYDADGYLRHAIPWSLSFNYSLRVGYGDFNYNKDEYNYRLTHALTFNGSIQPTKNWRLSFNATYDFDANKISYMTCNLSRNLHCWQMTVNFVPVGPLKSYTFSIAVSSSLLRDLKYNQSSNRGEGQSWY